MNNIIEKIYEFDHSVLLYIQENMRTDYLTPLMKISSSFVNIGILWILLSITLICIKRTRMIGIMTLTSLAFCINGIVCSGRDSGKIFTATACGAYCVFFGACGIFKTLPRCALSNGRFVRNGDRYSRKYFCLYDV